MLLKFTALAVLVAAVSIAHAEVNPATVGATLNLANDVGPLQFARPTTFGTHRLVGPGEATFTAGADAAATPFIQYAATTPDTAGSRPYVSGTLNYGWEITSADGARTPVRVHISTAGWVNARYGFGPYRAGLNLTPNSIDIAATASFMTQASGVPSGVDQRTYGLQSGGVYLGVTRLSPEAHFTPQNGGYSQVAGSFSTSFDLWVIPNTGRSNTIQLNVYTAFRQDNQYTNDYAREWYDSRGFIDPVITIDPTNAAGFSIVQSSIPMVPVPEVSTLVMMLGGLLVLAGVGTARRRS